MICEMSGSYYGYSGQAFCAIAIGEPTDELRELADFTHELFVDLCKVVKPGNTDADVHEVTARVKERGLDIEAPFIHAWGTHFGHPAVGFDSWTPWPVEFVEGQLMVVEPNPCTPDALIGIQLGNMTQVQAGRVRAAPQARLGAGGQVGPRWGFNALVPSGELIGLVAD